MKKTLALVLAMIMALCSLPVSAFAADVTAEEPATAEEVMATEPTTVEFEITPDMVDENGMVAIPAAVTSSLVVDQTWNFTDYHRGADRSYSSSSLAFSVRITDSNGNAVGDQVAIKLKDYYGNELGFSAYANGGWYNYNSISIVSGRTYYFYYDNLSSSTRTLKIRMQIYA